MLNMFRPKPPTETKLVKKTALSLYVDDAYVIRKNIKMIRKIIEGVEVSLGDLKKDIVIKEDMTNTPKDFSIDITVMYLGMQLIHFKFEIDPDDISSELRLTVNGSTRTRVFGDIEEAEYQLLTRIVNEVVIKDIVAVDNK